MKHRNILLLGASGYVGRDIKEVLLRRGHSILSPSRDELNCIDFRLLTDFIEEKDVDAIVMSVAKPFNTSTATDEAIKLFLNNLRTESTILSAAKALKIPNLFHIGSSSIYEQSTPSEDVALCKIKLPNSAYARSKYLTTESIELSRADHSLNWVNLIVPGVIGPFRENLTTNSYLIPAIVEKCRQGKTLQVPQQVLRQKREWVSTIDIGNTISILLNENLSVRLPNGRLNMSPRNSYLVGDVIKLLRKAISPGRIFDRNICEHDLKPRAKISQSLLNLEEEGLEYSSLSSMLNWLIKKMSIHQVMD